MKKLSILSLIILLFGCQSEQEEPSVNCSTYGLQIQLSSTTDANCGNADGAITVSATGGDGNYTFSLNGGNSNTNGQFTNVAAGVYTVTVKDNSPCSANVTATVNNLDGVQFGAVSLTDAGCSSDNGAIEVTAIEGVPPYSYAIDGGPFQDEAIFSQLTAGEYTVLISDAQDCETSQTVKVFNGTSWDAEVSPIIVNNCAISGCHAGTQPPDFREFANVVSNADRIKTRTGNGTMPPNATLSEEQKQLIACWVDDGARDN
ncbi:SprB repeat-containing protein [Fulvivirga sedimenti]|uniref:SprB repeat-containing protein n=1 Tax=Fulvivirga sedimenti TaxID=2879465 RepID=A0A9X1HR73_9BACT|nr:SprB repeat-containing protein [Fulvivirga sedimenti]MCA6074553.1 SprB repeat-containing protein [Fulvivirga sedimenti]MCA6075730.1 SprB repeat-containing protein [Fulvivirga sedimenti]MCA6076858.1 SprB repeat-containing protein [Fulvivirga sedimenti]